MDVFEYADVTDRQLSILVHVLQHENSDNLCRCYFTWASFKPNSMHTVAFNIVKSKADFARKQLKKIKMLSMPASRTKAAIHGIDKQT